MPNPHAFLNGFNVYEGLDMGYFELDHITIEHNVIVRYHNYEYPMTLEFKKLNSSNVTSDEANSLAGAFQKYTNGDEIVNSDYGNPYRCKFGNIYVDDYYDNIVILKSVGTSERIYK